MHPRLVAIALASALLAASIPASATDPRAYEQYLLDVPSAAGALNSSTMLASESHYAGTPGDLHMAQWMRNQLQADGFSATNESFFAQVPQQPGRVVLELMEKPRVKFNVSEVPIPVDPDGTRKDAGVIPFNAFAASGSVTAPLVDVGHGTDADYQALYHAGIPISGRIALISYGAEFRGALARRAQAAGALGILFWSNPADSDGSDRGPAYPDGPYRPLGSVQRGSLGSGIKIPTLPITAITAQRLLQSMNAHVSDAPVHLLVEGKIKHQLLWNTVGVLVGSDPTHTVILGGHRDAWVSGVTDNGAGISTLLETAHALGYLAKSGWRPRYTIKVIGFDGEEIGEVGSQEYVRAHINEVESGCLAYINEDENTTGQRFSAMSAAALESIMADAALRVKDPAKPTQQLYDRWKVQHDGLHVDPPAGGSDFEAFLFGAGIPVMSASFDGPFGVYHSSFDDLRYATTIADPGMVNHVAIAQLVAILTFRLTQGPLLYRLSPYAVHMHQALRDMASQGVAPSDLSALRSAVDRFTARAADVDQHGMNAGVEIESVHHLNKLFYGRNGYMGMPFPELADAARSGDPAKTSATAGRVAHDLDAISDNLHPDRSR